MRVSGFSVSTIFGHFLRFRFSDSRDASPCHKSLPRHPACAFLAVPPHPHRPLLRSPSRHALVTPSPRPRHCPRPRLASSTPALLPPPPQAPLSAANNKWMLDGWALDYATLERRSLIRLSLASPLAPLLPSPRLRLATSMHSAPVCPPRVHLATPGVRSLTLVVVGGRTSTQGGSPTNRGVQPTCL